MHRHLVCASLQFLFHLTYHHTFIFFDWFNANVLKHTQITSYLLSLAYFEYRQHVVILFSPLSIIKGFVETTVMSVFAQLYNI